MKDKKTSHFKNVQKETFYFQGIFQLRKPNEDILDFIKRELKENKHKGVFVAKEKKVPNGIDIYLSSNKFAINLGHKLYKKFGGVLKINEKLFSQNRQTSKNIYRMAIMYRPVDFVIGDFVSFGKQVIKVTGISKKISGINLHTLKTQLMEYEKDELKKLDVLKTTISKTYPDVEVLHPETYQSIKVKNPKNVQPGEKVKVVLHEGVWLVD